MLTSLAVIDENIGIRRATALKVGFCHSVVKHDRKLLRTSESCDSARAEFCTELAKVRRSNEAHRNCKILHILYSNIALSSAPTAAIASPNHLGVKVIK